MVISSSTGADGKCAGNSYVAPEMYSFADAMCRSRCGACDLIDKYVLRWAIMGDCGLISVLVI
jgi:hypothetical protein